MKRLIVALLGLVVILLMGQGQAQPSAPPEMIALAETLAVQLDRALQEASFAWIAATFEDVQANTQRVLNILVGVKSPDYNPIAGDFGDEVGALDNATALKDMLEESPWADFAVTAESVMTFARWAKARAKSVLETTEEEPARVEIHQAEAFLRAALACGDDLPTSGGAKAILTALRGSA